MDAGFVVVLGAVVAAGIGLRTVAFIDAVRRPVSAWTGTGRTRRFWIVVILVVPFAGAAAYFLRARPELETPN